MLKRVGEGKHPFRSPPVVRNQSAMLPLQRTALVAVLKRCLITRIRLALMFVLHGFPQSCMRNPVEGLFEVSQDMVVVLSI